MSNNQLMRKATLTASFVGIVGLSSLLSVKASHAATFDVNIPLLSYTLEGDGVSIASPDDQLFDNFFTDDFILFGTEGGTAISVNSPFIEPNRLKSVFAHFDYAFVAGLDPNEFQVSLFNDTEKETTFSKFLFESSTGMTKSIDLTSFYTKEGNYQLNFSSFGGQAGVNNFVIKIETVPEPTTTIGLLALGIGAVTLKHKGKIRLGVLSKSAS
ncbi:MAG: PEP-CTERM sorting domain-containing protein [Nodularia sp. (in: Bacteria)]|nr:MAG: PEP-CTERM sorting domain-containing protein [Nodularia sp. (in: cyanobacteria)]